MSMSFGEKDRLNLCLFVFVSLTIHGIILFAWHLPQKKILPSTSIPLELTPEVEDMGQAPETPALPPVPQVKQVRVRPKSLPDVRPKIPQSVKISPEVAEVKTPQAIDPLAENAAPEVPLLPSLPKAGKPSRKTYENYLGKVVARISANKYYPFAARMTGQTGKVVVSFVIDARGNVSQIKIEKPCRHEILNKAALTTIKRAEPFPPPPRELDPPLRLTVTIKFELK